MRIADARPLVSHLLSDAVWVALRPAQAYTRLAGEAAAVRWRHVLEYPAIALLAFAYSLRFLFDALAQGRVVRGCFARQPFCCGCRVGVLDEGADDPQEVSEVVFEALTANPPQTRYLVGQAARDVAGLLSLSDEDRDQAFLQMWQGATT